MVALACFPSAGEVETRTLLGPVACQLGPLGNAKSIRDGFFFSKIDAGEVWPLFSTWEYMHVHTYTYIHTNVDIYTHRETDRDTHKHMCTHTGTHTEEATTMILPCPICLHSPWLCLWGCRERQEQALFPAQEVELIGAETLCGGHWLRSVGQDWTGFSPRWWEACGGARKTDSLLCCSAKTVQKQFCLQLNFSENNRVPEFVNCGNKCVSVDPSAVVRRWRWLADLNVNRN